MNTGEKIAVLYLRLNGFLVLPQFTTFGTGTGWEHTHVDAVGVRMANSEECLEGKKAFPLDENLFRALSTLLEVDSLQKTVGIVAEVKGGDDARKIPSDANYKYIKRFLGGDIPLVKLAFHKDFNEVEVLAADHAVGINIQYGARWILSRFQAMEAFPYEVSKSADWNWSEEFLADLLYLKKIGL